MFSGKENYSGVSRPYLYPPLGLFDQLLNAMTEDSEEEEQGAVAGPGPSQSNKKLQHDDLD